MAHEDPDVTCSFCGRTADLDSAVDAGWFPSFYADGIDLGRPCCPECAFLHLDFGPEKDDDPALLPDHEAHLRD